MCRTHQEYNYQAVVARKRGTNGASLWSMSLHHEQPSVPVLQIRSGCKLCKKMVAEWRVTSLPRETWHHKRLEYAEPLLHQRTDFK